MAATKIDFERNITNSYIKNASNKKGIHQTKIYKEASISRSKTDNNNDLLLGIKAPLLGIATPAINKKSKIINPYLIARSL